jgi:hypothetical protein
MFDREQNRDASTYVDAQTQPMLLAITSTERLYSVPHNLSGTFDGDTSCEQKITRDERLFNRLLFVDFLNRTKQFLQFGTSFT